MQANREPKAIRKIRYSSKIQQKKCIHRNKIDLYYFRKNYPFGRNSKVVYSVKRIKGQRCIDCGKAVDYVSNVVGA